MMKKIKVSFIFFCILSVVLQAVSFVEPKVDSVEEHLALYDHFNESHYDDAFDEVHAHHHRHSEDGEEHEHHHDHLKINSFEIQLLTTKAELVAKIHETEEEKGDFEKHLISETHLLEFFRPPILHT